MERSPTTTEPIRQPRHSNGRNQPRTKSPMHLGFLTVPPDCGASWIDSREFWITIPTSRCRSYAANPVKRTTFLEGEAVSKIDAQEYRCCTHPLTRQITWIWQHRKEIGVLIAVMAALIAQLLCDQHYAILWYDIGHSLMPVFNSRRPLSISGPLASL